MEVMVDASGDERKSVSSDSSSNACITQKQSENILQQFTTYNAASTLGHLLQLDENTSNSFNIQNSIMTNTSLSQMMPPINHYYSHTQNASNFLSHYSFASSSSLMQPSNNLINSVVTTLASNNNDLIRSKSGFNNEIITPDVVLASQSHNSTNVDTNITLWQFLYELLKTGEHFSLIQWTNNAGEFKV